MRAWSLYLSSLMWLVAGTALAGAGDFRFNFVDAQGRPNESASKLFASSGLKLIKGVNIPLAAVNKAGDWELLDESACLVIAFRVSRAGAVDRFQVLDSEPKDGFSAAALTSIKQWQFEPIPVPQWLVLPLNVNVLFADGSAFEQPSRIKKQMKPNRPLPSCVNPIRKTDLRAPTGFAVSPDTDPVYPSPDLLRKHPAGCATVAFHLDKSGVPEDLELLDAKPDQTFVDLAALAVQTSRYLPGAAPVTGVPNPQFGFVRVSYADSSQQSATPDCMTSAFAAAHYTSTELAK